MLDLATLGRILERHGETYAAEVRSFELGGRKFAVGPEPDIMGVINLSPDSWYRESVCLSSEQAVRRGLRLIAEGAATVDIGAESTLPNAAVIDGEGQCAALLPVIRGLCAAGITVSVETYRPEVVRASLEAGARIINLTAAQGTGEMFHMVADHDAAVIACFVRGENVRRVSDLDVSGDHGATLYEYFARQVELAEAAGVRRLWLDPGMGFYYRNLMDSAERVRYQMSTFLETFRLRKLGWPTCHALPHAFEYFEDEVRSAEPFFAVLAILGRTDLLRTHEVTKVRGVVKAMGCFRGGGGDGR
ncbi:MAG TPA: dihydropteroate synthase [Verrucomicrobiae bacterium]|nr:dihydropteroate synthase [Verrucomicrobiae bacterium]